jgi:hypothetical protein
MRKSKLPRGREMRKSKLPVSHEMRKSKLPRGREMRKSDGSDSIACGDKISHVLSIKIPLIS